MKLRNKLLNRKDHLAGFVFISPWLIGFLGFTLIPVITSFYISFTDYDLLSEPVWNGLDNIKRMFTDELFTKSFMVTIYYVFVSVPLRVGFALVIAMLLSRNHKGIHFYRTIFYIPSLLGGSVAIAITWRMLFGDTGPIKYIIDIFFPEIKYAIIGSQDTAMIAIILLGLWQFGSSMIIFLAGLKNIPTHYYEAANIDGAGFFDNFLYITIPLLSPVIFFNVVMQTINSFIIFTQAYIVTGGGPANSTLVYSLYMFRRAFQYFDMGFASTMAWFLLLVIGAITGLFFITSKYWVFYEGDSE